MREANDLTTFIVPKVEKMWSLNLPERLGPPRPVSGHLYLYLNIWDYVKHGEERNVYRGGGILEERDHLEDPGIDARLIRKWVFK